ncbi:MAG: hypothetical protein AUH96_05365 [Nitrospirae bacterium 13_2_20CM_2_61_4]|nr:MAG: hypothetical protein AUH96_05365 [Nitrospirae bacterium 13_2_20CM_2_61_4]
MSDEHSSATPFAAQAIPFHEMLASGKIPDGLLISPYVAEQFTERLVHYVLSVPSGSYSMGNLSKLLEQLDPRLQVTFFKTIVSFTIGRRAFSCMAWGFPSMSLVLSWWIWTRHSSRLASGRITGKSSKRPPPNLPGFVEP